MRRHVLDLAVLIAAATVVLAVVAAAQPSARGIGFHVYLIVVGGLALVTLVSAAADRSPGRVRSVFERALAVRSTPPGPPAELERLQREVTLSVGFARDLHRRLLPTLREIASARLERSGRRPGPETLGPWWSLLAPDTEPPADRFAPGLPARDLRALVAFLERL